MVQYLQKDDCLYEDHANTDSNGTNLRRNVGDGVVPDVTSNTMNSESGKLGDEARKGIEQQPEKLSLIILPTRRC